MFKKLKENKKKGFTLVELIVVLVILAILAALLIPALTGYIDKAKNKSIVAETRQVVMAAQTLVDEAYAKNQNTTVTFENNDSETTTTGNITTGAIKKLAEVKGNITVETGSISEGKVVKITYTNGGKTCTYNPNKAAAEDGETQEGQYYVKKSSTN